MRTNAAFTGTNAALVRTKGQMTEKRADGSCVRVQQSWVRAASRELGGRWGVGPWLTADRDEADTRVSFLE